MMNNMNGVTLVDQFGSNVGTFDSGGDLRIGPGVYAGYSMGTGSSVQNAYGTTVGYLGSDGHVKDVWGTNTGFRVKPSYDVGINSGPANGLLSTSCPPLR
jgi:hypothetical protein